MYGFSVVFSLSSSWVLKKTFSFFSRKFGRMNKGRDCWSVFFFNVNILFTFYRFYMHHLNHDYIANLWFAKHVEIWIYLFGGWEKCKISPIITLKGTLKWYLVFSTGRYVRGPWKTKFEFCCFLGYFLDYVFSGAILYVFPLGGCKLPGACTALVGTWFDLTWFNYRAVYNTAIW